MGLAAGAESDIRQIILDASGVAFWTDSQLQLAPLLLSKRSLLKSGAAIGCNLA
jgi:hypothetical protein